MRRSGVGRSPRRSARGYSHKVSTGTQIRTSRALTDWMRSASTRYPAPPAGSSGFLKDPGGIDLVIQRPEHGNRQKYQRHAPEDPGPGTSDPTSESSRLPPLLTAGSFT